MTLTVKRGTNISHWMSQSRRRGTERRAFFTRDDVRRIADWGFDHIRLPMPKDGRRPNPLTCWTPLWTGPARTV
jgi:aryl-phospho-beta-D-glucosidase BglC (GH1 family)